MTENKNQKKYAQMPTLKKDLRCPYANFIKIIKFIQTKTLRQILFNIEF